MSPANDSTMPKPKLILIVEDDHDICDIMTLYFENKGYKVATISNSREAITMIQKTIPDILITDLKMPLGSGVELLQNLKAQGIKIPKIAVMSGYADFSQNELSALGAQAVVQKPCLPQDILLKLEEKI